MGYIREKIDRGGYTREQTESVLDSEYKSEAVKSDILVNLVPRLIFLNVLIESTASIFNPKIMA